MTPRHGCGRCRHFPLDEDFFCSECGVVTLPPEASFHLQNAEKTSAKPGLDAALVAGYEEA